MKKILIILGPTSTGKTDLALYLAKKFNGELISCDSRQVYTGLDIGTGKMPGTALSVKKGEGWWEIDGIRVWMYDVVSPKKQYTVADYIKDTNKVIENIKKKGKLLILVGGTGFYIKSLINGLPNLDIPVDKKLRKELEKLNLQQLQERLKFISSGRWSSLNQSDSKNSRRLIRAIEVETNNEDKTGNENQGLIKEFKILKIGLTASRDVLYQRADDHVVSRMEQGMIEEAERLNKKGLNLKRMKQLGLEYGVLAEYLSGKITTKSEFIKILQGKIHNYIRRQLTWFKKEENIHWFDVKDRDKIEKFVGKWYDSSRL